MKRIVIVKTRTLNAKDKEKLTKDDCLVIEHPNPDTVIIKTEVTKLAIENNNSYTYTNCCYCGERIYVTNERFRALKDGKKTFYCSHGHGQSYN